MTVLENTMSMLEMMPDSDVLEVQNYAKNLLIKDTSNPFQPLTRGQIMHDLEISTEQFENGQYSNADEVHRRIRDRYGI